MENPFKAMPLAPAEREDPPRIIPESEYTIEYARSSGPGGQKVNKTSSKAVLHWDVDASMALTDEEKTIIKERLANRINKAGELVLDSDRLRSQHQNRADVVEILNRLVTEVLMPQTPRIATKPTRGAQERRLEDKRLQSIKKRGRREEW